LPNAKTFEPIHRRQMEAPQHESEHPPRARLVLRVGVTGHRPGGLAAAHPEELDQRIDSVLTCLEEAVEAVAGERLYSNEPPCLRIVSSLAEGADRIVAHRALGMGFELQCPLPFHRDEYEKDFDNAESRREYRNLLHRATSVFELDGSHERGPEAYLAVGRLLTTHCDVLIAVWDGKPATGVGGTGQVVEEALLLGVPVVRIDSRNTHAISFANHEDPLTALERRVWRMLLPRHFDEEQAAEQDDEHRESKRDLRETYFKETRHWWRSPVYKLFEKLVSEGSLRVGLRLGKGEPLNDPAVYAHFEWATSLSVFYAELRRSAVLGLYVLAWLAVFCAVVPLAVSNESFKSSFVIAELACILIVASVVGLGLHYRWHERWLAYRMLAEQLRVLDYLAVLARTLPVFRPPVHLVSPDSNLNWVNWHFRSIVREIGLKPGKVTAEYVHGARDGLRAVIANQSRFHAATAHRCHILQRRLHFTGITLFILTALACATHLCLEYQPRIEQAAEKGLGLERVSIWLTIGAAILPAAGAALAGIVGQSEFERVGGRSHAMSVGLDSIERRLQDPATDNFVLLSEIAEDAAHIMTAEVQDWHVLFKGRPIELPS